MKNQVLKVTMIFCALMMFNNLSAQKLGKKAQGAIKEEVAEMTKVMDLSSEQQAQVLDLKTNLRQSNLKASKAHEKGSQELKDARKANMQSYMAEMKKVCSKEQLAKWKKYRKAKRNK